jgi:hypothetical protein
VRQRKGTTARDWYRPETGLEEVGRISNRKSACRKLPLRLASILDGFWPPGSNAKGTERRHIRNKQEIKGGKRHSTVCSGSSVQIQYNGGRERVALWASMRHQIKHLDFFEFLVGIQEVNEPWQNALGSWVRSPPPLPKVLMILLALFTESPKNGL